jgi:hypothetical protein
MFPHNCLDLDRNVMFFEVCLLTQTIPIAASVTTYWDEARVAFSSSTDSASGVDVGSF